MDLLRHGDGPPLQGARAPSTLGTFLRAFTFGHVRQLDAVAARLLARLASQTPQLPGADRIAYVDIDHTVRATHGYPKQGSGFGYSDVNGLNALLGIVSTPLAAPVVAGARLRKGRRTPPAARPTWSPTPQSLAEIFLRIGAACVVAPMWDVRLPVAQEWTTCFLRALRGRTDRGRAAAAQSASRVLSDAGAALQDVGWMQVHGDHR